MFLKKYFFSKLFDHNVRIPLIYFHNLQYDLKKVKIIFHLYHLNIIIYIRLGSVCGVISISQYGQISSTR